MNLLRLLFITNSPELAVFAVSSGVDRIFLDLEILGKEARQGHLDTLISRHSIDDVSVLRSVLPSGSLLVRVNPIHENSESEIDRVVRDGADIVMLPMFHGPAEVKRFCRAVGGRAKTCLLVETCGAVRTLADCLRVPGVDEVHIGLNDLHIDLDMKFMFEPFSTGLVDGIVSLLHNSKIPFGIGGVARVGEGLLPAEMLLGEHVRLGSTGAILSRTFHRQATTLDQIFSEMNFALEVQRLKQSYIDFTKVSIADLEFNRGEVNKRIQSIAAQLSGS